ncbi:MAG TPA: thiamine pyrophosphate-dependent enzyme [Luteibaculaceae bacterium]|nr:thiamine pyrophosphate-dependent enzyme [Luteibaculaceae bacterium]
MQEELEVTQNPNQVFINEILSDFKLACLSREASLLGRKEVLTGKAKFGIFGDGKELAQICAAKQFRNGDFRSGYYRDSTFMLAIGQTTVQQLFAGLYAHTDTDAEPTSGGRQMGGHFATRNLHPDGSWRNLMEQKNSSADISPTGGQMPRLLGLAQASKVYRHHGGLNHFNQFSEQGNEVAFGTIGDASTSEGLFWECMNAAGVLQVPMVMSVWDDGFGISVPKKYQTTKGSISEALAGFQRTADKPGFEIFKTKGWDYAHLIQTYEEAVELARREHVPVLVHVEELTQPQGHSTSGSHERYKDTARLNWEREYDCIEQFKKWILDFTIDGQAIATEQELDQLASDAKKQVRQEQKAAWQAFRTDLDKDYAQAFLLLEALKGESAQGTAIESVIAGLKSAIEPIRKDLFNAIRKALRITRGEENLSRAALINWFEGIKQENADRYSSHLYSQSKQQIGAIDEVAIQYGENPEWVDGRIILRDNFDAIFAKYPEALSFGEDLGKIGGVNQSWEGLQSKYGELRVSDVGIREASIVGQGIGMAMRGLRPIAEIQYLDYIFYALQILSDDLATLQYRTKGGQKAPLIISTRGHRLEGIWHAGSPMGAIINMVRGVHVCVPRNMTQAAGFYNTLMKSDEPAIVVEPLNGYRSKELMPTNIGEFCIPLGIPEITHSGTDITVVSYGSTFNLCAAALESLEELGVSVELIDARTLLPFDVNGIIAESLKRTNRLVIIDEDVSSGATAYMLDQILTVQKGYQYLDSAPLTLAAKDHRPAYGTDGDYFSKPSVDDIIEAVYGVMSESNPTRFPAIF